MHRRSFMKMLSGSLAAAMIPVAALCRTPEIEKVEEFHNPYPEFCKVEVYVDGVRMREGRDYELRGENVVLSSYCSGSVSIGIVYKTEVDTEGFQGLSERYGDKQ